MASHLVAAPPAKGRRRWPAASSRGGRRGQTVRGRCRRLSGRGRAPGDSESHPEACGADGEAREALELRRAVEAGGSEAADSVDFGHLCLRRLADEVEGDAAERTVVTAGLGGTRNSGEVHRPGLGFGSGAAQRRGGGRKGRARVFLAAARR
jgi:hypothetical protein